MAANDAGRVMDVSKAKTVEQVRTALGDGVGVVEVMARLGNDWNNDFTDAMLMVVAEMCPNLTSLNVWYCRNLTDVAVVAVAGSCPNLTSLNLSYCSNLTDAAVVAVAGGCPNLTSLSLNRCTNLTDTAVVAVAGGCPNLTSLNLSYCSNLTNAAVVTVAGGCPSLTSLNLAGCCNVALTLASAKEMYNIVEGTSIGSASRIDGLEAELADIKAELSTMQDLLTIATGNITALQKDRASIIDHFDKAIATLQATRR